MSEHGVVRKGKFYSEFSMQTTTPTANDNPERTSGLLVSVQNSSELLVALAAGVRWIDVKDPSRGALGRPEIDVAKGIRRLMTIENATDLHFSIKGIGAKPCEGTRNIPDGEVFSCPVKNSVQGAIQFNTPTIYAGTKFENIRLEFKDGRIVHATGSNEQKLNEVLDTDAGARYIGEFSLGFNPHILNPMCDILFDEKIAGSLHLTPGQAYEECDNGNRSAVHWDMVLIQRPEWGGGEIRFDGEVIRKDGLFLPGDLQGLNPDRLS